MSKGIFFQVGKLLNAFTLDIQKKPRQRLRLAKVVGDGGVNRWSTQNSVGSKTTLNGTKLVGTCHYKFV